MGLTSRQSRHLRALAHHLKPVVWVGTSGVTDPVVAKLNRELTTHELVKVRIDGERAEVRAAAELLATATGSELAQLIGKVAVLYRRRAKKPTIVLPEP